MIAPAFPLDECERLATLRDLAILDTAPEERFDRVTRLARDLFSVPIALVSLVDANRQWFKSRQGLDATETNRAISFCGHAILGRETFLVNDAAEDPRFRSNPLVTGAPHIRFYAGRPLAMPSGHRLGTLCIIDREPRQMDDEALARLDDLGAVIEDLLGAMCLATSDPLTGIPNVRGFTRQAERALAAANRARQQTALLTFRLPGLRQIADEEGFAAADESLQHFSASLIRTFRKNDLIARRGLDEFCALLTAVGPPLVPNLIERLRLDVARDAVRRGSGQGLEFNYGCAYRGRDDDTGLDALLATAEAEMRQRGQFRRDAVT